MNFNSHNFHKSGFIERWASNLSAIEFILGFRKRHKTVFNIIATVVVSGFSLFLILFVTAAVPKFGFVVTLLTVAIASVLLATIWKDGAKGKGRARNRAQHTRVSKRVPTPAAIWKDAAKGKERAKNVHFRSQYVRISKSKLTVLTIIVVALVALYLILALIGAQKVSDPYETARLLTLDYPVTFVEKNFTDHVKYMIQHPGKAWHYLWTSKEEIFMEIAIEISQINGVDTRNLEVYLGMYNMLS